MNSNNYIIEPAALKNIRRIISQVEKTVQTPVINRSLIKLIQKQQKTYNNIELNLVEPIQKLIVQLEPLRNMMEQIAINLQPIVKELNTVHIPLINSALIKLIEQQNNISNSTVFTKVETSIITQFKQEYENIQSSNETTEFDEMRFPSDSISIIEILNDKTELTKEDRKNYILSLNIIIGFIASFITIMAYFFPDNSQHLETQAMIQNLETTITRAMSKEVNYEVTKQVHVRALPSSLKESKIIDIAFPKQKLLLISAQPYWIQVEYFNEDKQETTIGWVSKRYTKKLP